MRAAARSLSIVGPDRVRTPAAADAQPAPGGGVNQLTFQAGSPSATAGGVDVAVTQKPTAGYKCIKLVIRVIDNASRHDARHSTPSTTPAENVSKSFAGLGTNRKVQVAVSATFKIKDDDAVEVKRISAIVTTR